jgi:hypothetical protein
MSLLRKRKEKRRASRKIIGMYAWIRLDGGFALRPCKIVDSTDSGARIAIDAAVKISDRFTLLMSRDAKSGRRARIKWRRGSQIGAVFQ